MVEGRLVVDAFGRRSPIGLFGQFIYMHPRYDGLSFSVAQVGSDYSAVRSSHSNAMTGDMPSKSFCCQVRHDKPVKGSPDTA